jgi:hypothetical protein
MNSDIKNAARAKREKARVAKVNEAYNKLRIVLSNVSKEKIKKETKKGLLNKAIMYIKYLEEELKESNSQHSSFSHTFNTNEIVDDSLNTLHSFININTKCLANRKEDVAVNKLLEIDLPKLEDVDLNFS